MAENFVLIDYQQNSLFLLHVHGENYNRFLTYHIFYALEAFGIVKDKSTLVNVYEVGAENDIEMVSLQHEERSQFEQFDLENIKTLFKNQCLAANNLETVILEFTGDSLSFKVRKTAVSLATFESKNVASIEYMGVKNMPEQATESAEVAQEPVAEVAQVSEEQAQVSEEQAQEPVSEVAQEPVSEVAQVSEEQAQEPVAEETVVSEEQAQEPVAEFAQVSEEQAQE